MLIRFNNGVFSLFVYTHCKKSYIRTIYILNISF